MSSLAMCLSIGTVVQCAIFVFAPCLLLIWELLVNTVRISSIYSKLSESVQCQGLAFIWTEETACLFSFFLYSVPQEP